MKEFVDTFLKTGYTPLVQTINRMALQLTGTRLDNEDTVRLFTVSAFFMKYVTLVQVSCCAK